MKILIVDDILKNLEAAKKASLEFPKIEFVFEQNSQKAFDILDTNNDINGVISDLFFPSEEKNCYFTEEFNNAYKNDLEEIIDSPDINEEEKKKACEKFLPLGLGLITEALNRGKAVVLHTDIHRHMMMLTELGKSEIGDTGYLFSGSIILKPLIDKGILSEEEVETNGKNSLRYFGGCFRNTSNPLHGYDGSPPKYNKERWVEVIKRCLKQLR